MNGLKIRGVQNFLGNEIPVIEGGFGEGQKVVLAKTIAEIHGVRLDKVNDLIKSNIDEFEEGIDLLDLKVNLGKGYNFEELGFTKMQFTKSKNIYLLSEQGYMALVGLMRTDKAREIRKQFRREYFTMRKVINSDEQLKAQLLLNIYNGGQDGIVASKRLAELEVQEATKPLLDKIEEDKPMVEAYSEFMNSEGLLTTDDTAKIIKIGKNTMLKRLRELNILRTDEYYSGYDNKWKKGSNHNMPYATYMKYFEVKVLPPKNGVSYCKLYVKPEGVDFIKKKINCLI